MRLVAKTIFTRRARGSVKIEVKDLKGALADLDVALNEEPTVMGYEDRARVYELMGKKELAKQDRERIKRLKDSPY